MGKRRFGDPLRNPFWRAGARHHPSMPLVINEISMSLMSHPVVIDTRVVAAVIGSISKLTQPHLAVHAPHSPVAIRRTRARQRKSSKVGSSRPPEVARVADRGRGVAPGSRILLVVVSAASEVNASAVVIPQLL